MESSASIPGALSTKRTTALHADGGLGERMGSPRGFRDPAWV